MAAAAAQESRESDYELVEGAGGAVVRLVEALFASEAMVERSQREEAVVGGLEGRVPQMVTQLPLLGATETGAGRGADLFSGLVVEAAWSPYSVEQERAVEFSLPLLLLLLYHLLCLKWPRYYPDSFAQSPS